MNRKHDLNNYRSQYYRKNLKKKHVIECKIQICLLQYAILPISYIFNVFQSIQSDVNNQLESFD